MSVARGKYRRLRLSVDRLGGVDCRSGDAAAPFRSPCARNTAPAGEGAVRKRMGYEVTESYPDRINGVYFHGGTRLVHSGDTLYWRCDGQERTYRPVADAPSQARALGGVLCVADGLALLLFDGSEVTRACDAAYIPTLMVSRSPQGGGAPLEPLNLLTGAWREQFAGNGTDTVYRLSARGLSPRPCEVKLLTPSGDWTGLAEGAGFSVERDEGTVTFASAPPPPPVGGMDNVIITAHRERPEDLRKIQGCTIAELYGVGGAPDRLFLSGNPECPHLDFHSQLNNPRYFGDTWYSDLGEDGCRVTGYSVLHNALATHKLSPEGQGSIVVREGRAASGEALFPAVNTLRGEAALAPAGFAVLGGEALFLTRKGVCAVAVRELTGERYTRLRSERVAPLLTREDGMRHARAYVHENLYLLALNNRVYLLDGSSPSRQPGEGYSDFQYECHVWEGLPAACFFEEEGRLCFGAPDGRLCAFFTDTESPASYWDNGEPYEAFLETPELPARSRPARRRFRGGCLLLGVSPCARVTADALRGGVWERVCDSGARAKRQNFAHTDFGSFTFVSGRSAETVSFPLRQPRGRGTRLRVGCAGGGECFELRGFALEYDEYDHIV